MLRLTWTLHFQKMFVRLNFMLKNNTFFTIPCFWFLPLFNIHYSFLIEQDNRYQHNLNPCRALQLQTQHTTEHSVPFCLKNIMFTRLLNLLWRRCARAAQVIKIWPFCARLLNFQQPGLNHQFQSNLNQVAEDLEIPKKQLPEVRLM